MPETSDPPDEATSPMTEVPPTAGTSPTETPADGAPSSGTSSTGSHRVLLAVYAVFALAAGARSVVQLVQRADEAPVAYIFSALAACTYVAGWFAIRRAANGQTGFASVMLWVELAGVAVVGTLSLTVSDWFPDASVWSDYGIGYGFVPAILPIVGLIWLHRLKQRLAAPAGS